LTAAAVVCLVTAPADGAEEIARAILEPRLAACVNIVPAVRSLYWWEGELRDDGEALLVIKTTSAQVEPIRAALDVAHPYDTFELVALDVSAGNPPYLRWITETVR
jgi:periplasmic divalent cation tolerance protein